MVYNDELARISLTYEARADQWPGELAVNTFWIHHHHDEGNPFDWQDAVNTLAGGVSDKLVSHWGAMSSWMASGYQITSIKAAHIDTNGKDLVVAVAPVAAGTLPGTGSSGVMPPEVAVCLSLFGYPSGAFVPQRGRKRGRIYLPYISGSAAGADGRLTSGYMDTVLGGWGAFLNDVQGMHIGGLGTGVGVPDYAELCVASKTGGIWTQVDHLAVDDHFDSQQRRQHQSPAAKRTTPINH